MGADEEDTLSRIKDHRTEVIDVDVAEYGGGIFKSMGDHSPIDTSTNSNGRAIMSPVYDSADRVTR
jgi:hypothetical protein